MKSAITSVNVQNVSVAVSYVSTPKRMVFEEQELLLRRNLMIMTA